MKWRSFPGLASATCKAAKKAKALFVLDLSDPQWLFGSYRWCHDTELKALNSDEAMQKAEIVTSRFAPQHRAQCLRANRVRWALGPSYQQEVQDRQFANND